MVLQPDITLQQQVAHQGSAQGGRFILPPGMAHGSADLPPLLALACLRACCGTAGGCAVLRSGQ